MVHSLAALVECYTKLQSASRLASPDNASRLADKRQASEEIEIRPPLPRGTPIEATPQANFAIYGFVFHIFYAIYRLYPASKKPSNK